MAWLWLLWLAALTNTTSQAAAATGKRVQLRSRNLSFAWQDSTAVAAADRRETLPRLRFQPHDRQQGVNEPQQRHWRRLQQNDKDESKNTSVWNQKYVGARVKNWLYFVACLVVVFLSMVNIFTCCSWCCCTRASEADSRDRLDTLDSRNMDSATSKDEQSNPVAASTWCCCPLRTSTSRVGRLNGSDSQQEQAPAVGEKKLVILSPASVATAAGGAMDSSSNHHHHLTSDDQSTSHSATSGDVADSEHVAIFVETTVAKTASATSL
jgi:hypothetical protein